MKKLLLMALFGSLKLVYTQSWFPLSQPLSVSGTSVTDEHRRGLFQNPALLANTTHPLLFAEYDSRYGITELSSKGLQFSYPFSHFTVSADFRYSGFSAYHEMLAGLAFSRIFGDRFSMGLQFILDSRYAIETDRYYTTFYPQLGLTLPLSDNLLLGFSVTNPFMVKMKFETETRSLPSVYSLGLKLGLSESVNWRIQADQEISNQLRVGTAVDFNIIQKIGLQAGVQYIGYFVPAIGAGFYTKSMRYELTTTLHPLLGLTVAGGISYQFL